MLKKNSYYKMNVDLVKDVGSNLLVGTIIMKAIKNIGEITQERRKKIIRKLMPTIDLRTIQEGTEDKIMIDILTPLKEIIPEKRKDKERNLLRKNLKNVIIKRNQKELGNNSMKKIS